MFFGKPFNQSHPWGSVFRFKNDPEYAHHVFASVCPTTLATLKLCWKLFAAYKECMCSIYRARCVAAESLSIEMQTKLPNFNNDAAMMFQAKFDGLCRYLFLHCFTDFNNYSMPIFQTSDFTNYLNISKNIFTSQWVCSAQPSLVLGRYRLPHIQLVCMSM